MEEKHICRVCFRSFDNGKDLGGHMRSHKDEDQVEEIEQLLLQSIHYSSYSSSQGQVGLQDCESETESSKSKSFDNSVLIFGRRSKRARKARAFCSSRKVPKAEEERSLLSSASDTTTEEDLAHCLMMMSRDKWERQEVVDVSEDSSHVVMRANVSEVVRGKYRCETCNKLFKSYQALGGHRANYKKIKADVASPPPPRKAGAPVAGEKVHQCPFCDRVFASGQALGGHKRSHFMGAKVINFKNW